MAQAWDTVTGSCGPSKICQKEGHLLPDPSRLRATRRAEGETQAKGSAVFLGVTNRWEHGCTAGLCGWRLWRQRVETGVAEGKARCGSLWVEQRGNGGAD